MLARLPLLSVLFQIADAVNSPGQGRTLREDKLPIPSFSLLSLTPGLVHVDPLPAAKPGDGTPANLQGFGRLLRTHSDYGVVALLDGRVHDRSYGRRLLASLPPARRTEDFEQVRAFWENLGRG